MSEATVGAGDENVAEVDEVVTATMSEADLRAELTRVRREAAAKRVENNQLKAAQAELQKYKDAEKTELERLAERAQKAEEQASALVREKTARAAAKAAGLDPDLAEFLKGSTPEELKASAEALAAKTKANSAVDFIAGKRGAAVTAPTSAGEQFRNLFTKSN